VTTQILLSQWVELKRWNDFKNPGSQGDGSFLGVTDPLKGTENGYPGGAWFDPMGLARGDAAQYKVRRRLQAARRSEAAVAAQLLHPLRAATKAAARQPLHRGLRAQPCAPARPCLPPPRRSTRRRRSRTAASPWSPSWASWPSTRPTPARCAAAADALTGGRAVQGELAAASVLGLAGGRSGDAA
jgi:hypothetical protein